MFCFQIFYQILLPRATDSDGVFTVNAATRELCTNETAASEFRPDQIWIWLLVMHKAYWIAPNNKNMKPYKLWQRWHRNKQNGCKFVAIQFVTNTKKLVVAIGVESRVLCFTRVQIVLANSCLKTLSHQGCFDIRLKLSPSVLILTKHGILVNSENQDGWILAKLFIQRINGLSRSTSINTQ